MSEKFSNVAKLMWLYFCAPRTKSTSQARIKPEIFVNFRPEPESDPKSPARPTTLKWLGLSLVKSYLLNLWHSESKYEA